MATSVGGGCSVNNKYAVDGDDGDKQYLLNPVTFMMRRT